MPSQIPQHFFFWIWRRKARVTRGLLCWALGCLLLSSDETKSYDTRLQIRGDQPASSSVVIVNFKASEVSKNLHSKFQEEASENIENSVWDPQIWSELFQALLSQSPRSVAVSIEIPEFASQGLKPQQMKLLQDPRVFWGTSLSQTDRVIKSAFGLLTGANLGLVDLFRDDDGLLRRFSSPSVEIPHLMERATGKSLNFGYRPRLINFRGSTQIFSSFSVQDILKKRIPPDLFKNKVIILGLEGSPSSQMITPVGILSKAQIYAHIADNLLENRWVSRTSFWIYSLMLLVLTLIAMLIIGSYPPSVAFVFLLWLTLLSGSLSIWIFDSFSFWLPFVSPIALIAITWVIFVGHQANRMEKKTWALQQEQKYLRELEQLKNNFVSLISHDLKTPIAKIQSITDRLLMGSLPESQQKDLRSLKMSSEELHKYIQSVLKLLRVESRDLKLNNEVCDLNALIEDAVWSLQPLALEKSIQLQVDLEPLFSIEADQTLIREVLINLVENAIKYSNPLPGETLTVVIRSREIEDWIQVEVIDQGQGISTEESKRVWQKFARGKDEDLKTKGTGLGLYLVKYFIELHGGTVNLESTMGKGTTVSFRLPVEAEKA